MAKIALVGAGGIVFAQNFIRDILLDETLRHSKLVLMDIDSKRLENAVKFLHLIEKKLNRKLDMEATTILADAIRGADYVITIFRVGTIREQEIEYAIPMKYGVDQVVGDSMGPGGIFRGLRTLKALFEVVDTMERECPGAWLLNYVNPMSINTIALNKRSKTVKVLGLCHSVQGMRNTFSNYTGIAPEKLSYIAAGVNHQAFVLKLEADGKDIYPLLHEAMNNPDTYKLDKVRFEIFRHFGYFPTESSGHASEYLPYFRKRRKLLERFCRNEHNDSKDTNGWWNVADGVSGGALNVCKKNQILQNQYLTNMISGEKEIPLGKSNEYAVQIIGAIEKNQLLNANLNVINHSLIPSLPPEACVEVPCLVNSSGIYPCRIENYPEQLAGLNRMMINAQLPTAEGALTEDREKIIHALYLDPLTASSRCSLEEIRMMGNEMFDALITEISPGFQKK